MERLEATPGFFGKLPSHGDFVGAGLPPPVRDCFDRWLQEMLLHGRRALGEDWVPAWMTSPLWRFLMAAGLCGPQPWAGVMMPSHDRVGRCFPLLLAAPMESLPALEDCLALHDAWFARLEDLALACLEDGFTLADLGAGLRAGAAGGAAPRKRHAAPLNAWSDIVSAPARSVEPGIQAPGGALRGRSAWWSDGAAHLPPALALCGGLPEADGFTAFLDGRWNEHGWRRMWLA
jgi:type VI secretion system protein ImpM